MVFSLVKTLLASKKLKKRKLIKHDGKKALPFIIIFTVLLFFSSSAVCADPDLDTQNLHTDNSYIKNNEVKQDTQVQDTQAPVEKKKYSFLSSQSFANSTTNSQKKEASSNTDALSVSLGLIFILIIIFSLAWFMKRMGYSNLSGQGQLKIVASLNLGTKEKIALIQVGRQQLLVGITATQINTLHVLDEPVVDTKVDTKVDIKVDTEMNATEAQESTTGNGSFANKFSELLKTKHK